ncbi:MAG: 30S ribosomal protein S6 [Alphaproteobacteria bacterium]|nr:30S ribosomal protein S6 [Alphaproteobacteria bacterium]MBF0356371.1 30S ribosomal protein S6 [Alphaproteobacteria bacterium]
MSFYENVFIARQDIAATQVEALAEQFGNVIVSMGGKVSKKEYWGLKSFSFKIKKNRKGHYILMNLEADGPAVKEMERQMGLHEDIVRYLTVRVDELEEGPSAMMRSRDRDDRPRRPGRGFDAQGDEA